MHTKMKSPKSLIYRYYYAISDYFITSEIESWQSKLEKKDEIVKELESTQERKSYVTLQLNSFEISFHIIIEVKPLQTEIFDKTYQVEELQTSLEMEMKELVSLQERKSCPT